MPPDDPAASTSPARRRVLSALVESRTPLDAASVAARVGLHVTTVRFHLDQLVAAGAATRRSHAEGRRGRPRILFAPAGPARDENVREQLIEVLATALAHDGDASPEALRAGRRWAGSFDTLDPQDPVPGLVDVLSRLGFGPEPDPGASTIALRSCPFREAARAHPDVVCAVHRGLIDQLCEGTGHRAELIPFIAPDRCTVSVVMAPTEGRSVS